MAADHNFDELVLRALVERLPSVNVVRIRDVGLARAPDPQVLDWAAGEGRVLLTHDRATMPGFAYERVREGRRMSGVVEVPRLMPIGRAIDDLEIVVVCSREGELEGRVVYLPL